MISVCIPVYNQFVQELVHELVKQAQEIHTTAEILLVDDGSEIGYKEKNRQLSHLEGVYYHEFEQNKGRIAARNALAAQAVNDWLLFIDSDSQITSKHYIKDYISLCTAETDAIFGGRVYSAEPPSSCNKTLHWKYGRQRERNRGSHTVFMTNNFCIRKTIFQELDFPHQIEGYGHEDTWLGIELKKRNAPCRFIQNAVLHNGVEEAGIFIEKSINALKNLLALQTVVEKDDLKKHVRLYRFYCFQKKLGLGTLLLQLDKLVHAKLLTNLYSCSPSLLLFDLYRLMLLVRLSRERTTVK